MPSSGAIGCLARRTARRSSTTSCCGAGRTSRRTVPPSNTTRVSWRTSAPPQKASTSNNLRKREAHKTVDEDDKGLQLGQKSPSPSCKLAKGVLSWPLQESSQVQFTAQSRTTKAMPVILSSRQSMPFQRDLVAFTSCLRLLLDVGRVTAN